MAEMVRTCAINVDNTCCSRKDLNASFDKLIIKIHYLENVLHINSQLQSFLKMYPV